MSTSTEAMPQRANGLATYFAVITSPRSAFDTLARIPTWGWAAIIGILLTVVGAIVSLPATLQIAHIAQQQRIAELPADSQVQANQAIAQFAPMLKYFIIGGSAVLPWIAWLIFALVYLIVAAIAGGSARFLNAWVAAVNAYAVSGIAQVVQAVILRARPIESMNSQADVYVIPSFAAFVHDNPKLAAFAYGYNVLYVWSYVVGVIALERVMKVSRPVAIITMVVLSVALALLGTTNAR